MSESDESTINNEINTPETPGDGGDPAANTPDDGGEPEAINLSVNERNRLLIELDRLKWPGLNLQDLVKSTYQVLQQDDAIAMLQSKTNQNQVAFAKRVWNQCTPQIRRHFLPSANSWMSSIGSSEETINILTDALDQFERNVKQGKDDSKYMAYCRIKAKYDAAIAKRTLAADNPFVEPLTPGELRLIETFQAKERNREPRQTVKYEKHYPNQNAVTYPYILGKMMVICHCNIMDNEMLAMQTMDDVFKFLSVHGQKGHSTLSKQVIKWISINGPSSGVDIKPALMRLLQSDSYKVANSQSSSNKYLPNYYLTLKRMIRVVHICSKYSTPWGMLEQSNEQFTESLKGMHNIETQLGEIEKFSLAMVWYKCINRDNICTIMVDHHEFSANNILAQAIGKQTKSGLDAAEHAFPFDKPTNTSFGNTDTELQQEE